MRSFLLFAPRALALAPLFCASLAFGEPTAADKSLATQLFKEGRTLVDQGKVPDGCRKLEESQRLDPGGGTLLNVALCHEKEGRTATAWTEFTEALGLAKKDDRPQRIELAQTHIALLEPTLSRLVIQIPEGADFPELEIKRDGSAIRRAAWGSAMPVDPGEHIVEASGHGKISWKHSVTVGGKADTKTIVVPPLEAAPMPPPGQASAPLPIPAPSPETRPVRQSPAGWVAVGFGAVGLGVGGYFGLRAMSKQKDADGHCPRNQCDATGADQNADAIRSANLATVGFSVGVIGLGIGTVLLLTSGGSSRTSATGGPTNTTSTRGEPDRPLTRMSLGASLSKAGGELTVSGRW